MSLISLIRTVLATTFITTLSFNLPAAARCEDSCDPHYEHNRCNPRPKLAGTYFVCGFDPYLDVHYEGTLVIKHLCCTAYSFQWTYVDGSIETGTGIYDKVTNTVAVSFTDSDSSVSGVELIRISERKTVGRWVHLGECKEGRETLVKLRCSSDC
jgi:hypothetical protein